MRNKIKGTLLCLVLLLAASTGAQNPCYGRGPAYSALPGDTTILLPGGTQLRFNRCEFFDLRDCLELTEMNDLQSLSESGMTTQDNSGASLLTFGMVRIELKPGCAERNCFEVPVRVRFPLRTLCARCGGRRMPTLYRGTAGGSWLLDSIKSDIVTINGQDYLEFEAPCPGKAYNADCKASTTKVKFKARNWRELDRLEVSIKCPLGRLVYVPREGRRKVKAKLYCVSPDSVQVQFRGRDSAGRLVTETKPLSALDHGSRRKACKGKGSVVRRILGIFPVRPRNYYRKYFVS
jgi:hypothetical protein